MRTSTRFRTVTLALSAGLAAALLPAPAAASEHKMVDRSRLQPVLNPRFDPWDCKLKQSGPVCTADRHLYGDWELTDLPCAVPVWSARTEHRYQTLFFDDQYRNYHRKNRTNDIDEFRTSAGGPATSAVTTTVRYFYTFGVPGDLSTVTLTTEGVIWDLRRDRGPALFRAVGTLVEHFNGEPATFSGVVTIKGEHTRYENEPLETFFSDELFVSWLCEAATGTPAAL